MAAAAAAATAAADVGNKVISDPGWR